MTRVVLNEAGFRELQRSPSLRDKLQAIADRTLVAKSRARAPKRTGFGARSIHGEPVFVDGEWTVRVGWSRDAYYMRFHQFGTRYLPARPFLAEE
jgi:HK97 gp10 family phage protein